MARKVDRFAAALDELETLYGEPKKLPPKTPLAWILWENVAYLVDDERRERAFRALATKVGLSAEKIAKAAGKVLLDVTTLGGMHPDERVLRLKAIAALAIEHGGGELEQVLDLEPRAAMKVLKRFPSIGDPGAEKILLFCGVATELPLESNGLRVVVRLGYGQEAKGYAATYKSAREALRTHLVRETPWLARAHVLLRTHGQAVCKRTGPDCDVCPLTRECAWYAKHGG